MSSRHIAFILNERSSSGRGKRVWDQVVAPEAERLLGKDGFTLHLTQRPRHGTELAIELINQHCADTTQAESSDIRLVIVCVGGDGTVSEVVSGYLDANGVGKGVAIGIIAAGTGNDFVKSIPGYPSKDPAAALRAIIACKTMRISAGRYTCRRIPGQTYGGIQSAVASPALPPSTSTSPPPLATTTALEATLKDTELQIQTVDSGIGNSTADVAKGQRHGYFVNIISCAMSGEVIKNSESSPLVKLLGGTLGYLLLAAWNIFSFRNRRAKITYSRENTTAEPTATSSSSSSSVISLVLNLFLLCICNGQYFGGDMRVSDSAKLDDPNLHAVTVFDSGVWFALTRLLPQIKFGALSRLAPKSTSGNVESQTKPPAGSKARCDTVTQVTAEPQTPDDLVYVEADGELVGVLPMQVTAIPNAINLIIS